MSNADCLVSIVVPLYNQGAIIEGFIAEISPILRHYYTYYEIILINDSSEDNTAEIITHLLTQYDSLRLINLSRHFGTEIAISSGLDSAIGDVIVVMLACSDPPQKIPELVEQCLRGHDILIGVRPHRQEDPFWMRMGASLFYWGCQRFLKIPLTKNATQFRVLSRQVVNALMEVKDKYRYLRLLSVYIGFNSQTFVYEPVRRMRKPRSRSLSESLNLALQIIFMNSVHPLRFASYLSVLASLLNVLYMGYIVLVYFIKEKVAEGWITLSVQNAVMFFFISVILAILCEYIGLMLAKSRGWAAYYITDEKSSSVLPTEQQIRNVVLDSKNIKI